MNTKTSIRIHATLKALVRHYVKSGREIPAAGVRVHMTPKNIKNLAYHDYLHVHGESMHAENFEAYAGDFYARHVQLGAAYQLRPAAGMGTIPVRIIEHAEK